MRRSTRTRLLLDQLTSTLSVLTPVLAVLGTAAAERASAGISSVYPHVWMLVPSGAAVVTHMSVRRGRPAPMFISAGVIASVAVLGIGSIGLFFVPAAFSGTVTALAYAARSPRRSALAPVWFGIGLTAMCVVTVLYSRSQSYDVRWSGGFSAGRVTIPPIIGYGAWVFALLVSLVAGAALYRKLAASRH